MKQRSIFKDILIRFDENEIISKFSIDEILSRLTKYEIYQKYTSEEILEMAKRYADEYTEGFITTYCVKGKWYTRFGMDGEKLHIERLTDMAQGNHYLESLFNALYNEVYEPETENHINFDNIEKFKIEKISKEEQKIKRLPYLTTGEAEDLWSKPKGTIRNLIHRGKLENEIKKGLIKRTGKLWMVDEKLMYELYGEPQERTGRLVGVNN